VTWKGEAPSSLYKMIGSKLNITQKGIFNTFDHKNAEQVCL